MHQSESSEGFLEELNKSMVPYISEKIANIEHIAKFCLLERVLCIKFSEKIDVIEAANALPCHPSYYVSLNFFDCKLGDKEVEQLLGLLIKKPIKLAVLCLSSLYLSDKSTKSICDFILNKEILILRLQGSLASISTGLKEESCEKICETSYKSKTLLALSLRGNDYDERIYESTQECLRLKRLALEKQTHKESLPIKPTLEKETAEAELASAKQVIKRLEETLDETHEELFKELEKKSKIIEALREENERLKRELDSIKNPDQENQAKAASTIQGFFRGVLARRELSHLKKAHLKKERVDFIKSKMRELLAQEEYLLLAKLSQALEKNNLIHAMEIIREHQSENNNNLKNNGSMLNRVGNAHDNIIRKGLTEITLKNLSQTFYLPENYIIAKSVDDGGCFFDALAQALNVIKETDIFDEKFLRMQCHEYYLKNKEKVDQWNNKDYGGIDKGDEYYKIQYTNQECIDLFSNQMPLWGRSYIEGKILCEQLNLSGIYLIELLQNPEDNSTISHCLLITKDACRSLDEDKVNLSQHTTNPILIVSQESLHFVPVLPRNFDPEIQNYPQETTQSQNNAQDQMGF